MIVCGTASHGSKIQLPLFSMKISAGPPSPAEDYIEEHVDIAQYLISHPETTFLVRVSGNSMIDAGINDGDLLVVERTTQAESGDIVIAVIGGQFTVKTFQRSHGSLSLIPANKLCPELPRQEFAVWGVAKYSIHKL